MFLGFERDVGDDNGQVEQHTRGRRYVEPETTARYPGPETGHVAENTPEIGGALHIEDRTVLPQLPPPPVNLHPSQFPRVFPKLKRTPTPSPHATKPYHLETMPRTETVQQRYGANKDDVQSKGIKSQRQETIGRHAITKRENVIELASDETLVRNAYSKIERKWLFWARRSYYLLLKLLVTDASQGAKGKN